MRYFNCVSSFVALYIALLLCSSCQKYGQESISINQLLTSSPEAVDPYLTHDHKGNVVLCWTEKDASDSSYCLRYAVYNEKTGQFNSPVTVTASKGTRVSAESMNKIAFKSDGTVIAVFGKRFENENPYAGGIFYSMSSDEGSSWTKASFLHSDTSHAYGRSFFDVATLKDGEVAAIWLDGRYGKGEPGSALFFARTRKGRGFDTDQCIGKSTCECCRTDLLSDNHGNIHIAYRGILFPSALLGKQTRDMLYVTSKDYGYTFSAPKQISKDNWAIEGCPHTGPSLSVVNSEVHALWFTAGGKPGLYHSHAASPEKDFNSRVPISVKGKHPQMTSFADGMLAMTWEEDLSANSSSLNKKTTHSHSMSSHSRPSAAQIALRIGEAKGHNLIITDGKSPDHHPVITPLKEGLFMAWINEKNGKASIYYSVVKPQLKEQIRNNK